MRLANSLAALLLESLSVDDDVAVTDDDNDVVGVEIWRCIEPAAAANSAAKA